MSIIKVLGIGIICFILLVVLVIGYFGFMPGVSDVLGTNKPRDLGIKFSDADYASGLAKIPGHSITNPEDVCITCPYSSTGSVPVDATFSQEEFSAQLNKLNSKKGPLRNIQIKFDGDGTIEASGMVTDPRISAPVFLKGKIETSSTRNVIIKLDTAEVGRFGISPKDAPKANEIANQAIGEFFNSNPGLSIESLQVLDGKIKFKGTFPQSIEGNPSSVPMQLQ